MLTSVRHFAKQIFNCSNFLLIPLARKHYCAIQVQYSQILKENISTLPLYGKLSTLLKTKKGFRLVANQ